MRKVFVSFVLLTVVALLATACLLQEPEEASPPIETIPLAGDTADSEGDFEFITFVPGELIG